MSKTLVVNNTAFEYPDAGDPKGWGEEATAWATEVTAVISDLKGPNDLLQSSFTIANNTSVAADVVGLIFDPASVRSAEIEYNIYRTTDSVELNETGSVTTQYNSIANTWSIQQDCLQDSGVTLTILPSGQFQYTSSNVSGLNYAGTITFRAKTLDQ